MIDFLIPPWAHQRRDILRAAKLPAFGLFYEQGTGKTSTAINILRMKYGQAKQILPTLIVVPPNVLYNWVEEWGKNSKIGSRVVILYGSEKKRIADLEKALARKQLIHITPYTSLHMKDLLEAFFRVNYACFVADEFHRLKNRKAKQTKAVIKLVDGDPRRKTFRPPVAHRLGLTGSPVLNNGGMDLWALYRILDGGNLLTDNFFTFRNIYYTDQNARWASKPGYFPDYQPNADTEARLNAVIYNIAARVLKKDCLDLPELVKQRIHVELSAEQRKHYAQMEKDFIAFIEKAGREMPAQAVAQLALTQSIRLRQIVTGFVTLEDGTLHTYADNPRLTALQELLEDLAPHHKVIVWATFRHNYEAIRGVLRTLNLEWVEVNGDVPDPAQKHANSKRFGSDPKCRVMLANQASAGEGMNFQVASYSVYYSRSHSMLEDTQSEARNHRGGSEVHEKITRIDLVTKDSIDELVLQALAEHKKVSEAILAIAKRG